MSETPTIRLKPKANARAIRHGFPWAYDNEIVTDRRTKALAPGSIVRLEDAERNFIATGTANPASRIFFRVLDRLDGAVIDDAWLTTRITRAAALRERLYDTPFYRLAHAEGDGLPGLVIDRFGEAAVIQPNAAWADALAGEIATILTGTLGLRTVVLNGMGRARKPEGLPERMEVLAGALDGPVPVPMNGAIYMADLMGGQKTGLFYDQRPNHAFAAGLVTRQTRMLDVFSHVGGFALAALAAGAESAMAVDGSAPALELAVKGAHSGGMADRFTPRQGDAFQVMEALAAEEQSFGLVVCDPPAFAPNKQALEPGLRAYERVAKLAAPLVEPGGYLALCSCSHAADLSRFRAACTRGIGRAGRSAQLLHSGFAGPDHPQHPQLAESGYLKALFFRLD